MQTKQEKLEAALQELSKAGSIEGSAIISRDGLLIASYLPERFNKDTFAAMSATMTGAAETAVSEIGKGIPSRILVETKSAKVISVGAGSKMILVVIAEPNANVGLLFVEMQKAVKEIIAVMEA